MANEIVSSREMLKNYHEIANSKANMKSGSLLFLGFLAGIFIALGAAGSITATAALGNPMFGRIAAALIFPVGISMVVIVGAELFTGNALMLISTVSGYISVKAMMRSWIVVYFANFVGAIFVAVLVNLSGQLAGFGGEIARMTIVAAAYKTGIPFEKALALGIFCNFLVCVGIWMSMLGTRVTDKILGVFLPIMLFVLCGFEHSIANMYFIPAGIIAKMNSDYAAFLPSIGGIEDLTWGGFAMNLIPVTIGNIIGGALLFGLMLSAAHRVKK